MSGIDDLPPLRQVIARHDLRARKQLGQNFLLDLNLTAKIARQAGDISQCDVLEIGPGPGGLTRGLLAEGAGVSEDEARMLCAGYYALAGQPDEAAVMFRAQPTPPKKQPSFRKSADTKLEILSRFLQTHRATHFRFHAPRTSAFPILFWMIIHVK